MDEEFEQRELGDSSIAALARLLEGRQYETALQMAQRFHEAQPQATHFAMAYAFCLIPINAARARSSLENFQPSEGSIGATIREINLASCALIDRNLDKAAEHVASIVTESDSAAWLWDPVSLVLGEPLVRCWPIEEWAEQFTVAESMLTPRTAEVPSSGS